jgi:hypothetical protein
MNTYRITSINAYVPSFDDEIAVLINDNRLKTALEARCDREVNRSSVIRLLVRKAYESAISNRTEQITIVL